MPRVRKDRRAWLSPGTELLLGLCLMLIAVVVVYANTGEVTTAIVFWLGFVLFIHALYRVVRQRIMRRRLPTGPLLLLLVCGVAWLAFPQAGHAAIAGSVHGGGQWDSPTTPIRGWWGNHSRDDAPPTGCRHGTGWTEGTFPSLNVDLGDWTISWRKTYKFSMGIKVCWFASGYLGLIRKFKYWHVIRPTFSDVDTAIIQNPKYEKTEAKWDPDNPNCLNIRVKGLATFTPLPVPGLDKIFPIVSTATIHFWVDFKDVCTDGTVGDVEPDDHPY